MTVDWQGVFPALMTEFTPEHALDLGATAAHVEAEIEAGVDGLIVLGTLGENTSLSAEEKRRVVATAVDAAADRVPVLAGVAEYTTAQAVEFVCTAAELGADGAMVLPPMVYRTDPRETVAHFRTLARASGIPLMIYNNPVVYGTDVTPTMLADLADEPAIVAIKESSDDPRRLTDIANACGERFRLFCGIDDLIVESVAAGATGWVAGLVNAFPEESIALFRLAREGRLAEARRLYRWFMPLLHLDTHVKLVQYIKLANAMTGLGFETVRPPRLPLEGEERERVADIIQEALDSRPGQAAAAE